MFVLAACQENIRIVPQDLHKEQLQAITDEIEKTYFDKVRTRRLPALDDVTSVLGNREREESVHSRVGRAENL
jgi:DNA-directed RNA polymerase subunit E'/Rpb7